MWENFRRIFRSSLLLFLVCEILSVREIGSGSEESPDSGDQSNGQGDEWVHE